MILLYVFSSSIRELQLELIIKSPLQMTFLVPTSIILFPQTFFISSSRAPSRITWSPGSRNIWYQSMAAENQIRFLMISTAGMPNFFFNMLLCNDDMFKRRIAAAPPFSGLRRFPQGRGFKQWTGDDSKALMKVHMNTFLERFQLING